MSRHTELIASLRAESDELIKYQFSHTKEAMSCLQRLHDLSLEAADALQALERVPMTEEQLLSAKSKSGFTPDFHARFMEIYFEVRRKIPDLATRAIMLFDDDHWGRGTKEYGRAVHYGLMVEHAAIREAHHGITPPESKG